ncbi:hypothetical protein MWU75_01395 [Ornithinimicrobium sp. F0845]|uniref:hypothetical protein n=1 Tax=Ornithinimicrobium sp. F0845 TaxID=2926412 RepID=UPI001FF30815|nr:hypothetical protein [Ornithinimicrobium sp. F0845]MCK0110797.1 hypothetical protein [Ornithinimicrobium sp. F0845]
MSGDRAPSASRGEELVRRPPRSGRPGRIGVGRALCPCGREVDTRHHGFWSGVANFVLIPVLTLGLYTLVVFIGLELYPGRPVGGLVIMLLPVVSLVVTTLVHLLRGHRWGCLARRAVGWWLWWPGGVLSALAFA